MSADSSPRPEASTQNRALLVGAVLTALAVLSQAASPVAALVVLYGP